MASSSVLAKSMANFNAFTCPVILDKAELAAADNSGSPVSPGTIRVVKPVPKAQQQLHSAQKHRNTL